MAILNVGGIGTTALKKSEYNIHKETARKFGEYYRAGVIDFEAAKGEGDKIQISNSGNVQSKMKNLEIKFAGIDFSNMSDTEAFDMVEEAYNREFPEFRAYERLNQEMFSKVTEQRDNLLKRALNIKPEENFHEKVIEVYKKSKGYEGMADWKIAESIKNNFKDNGTHLNRTKILNERVYTGLTSPKERDTFIKDMQCDLERKFCLNNGIHRIEDAQGEERKQLIKSYGEFKFKFYEGGFDKPNAQLPPLDEIWNKMVTALGEYILEVKPQIDEFQEEMKDIENVETLETESGNQGEKEEKFFKDPDIDPEKQKGKERDASLKAEKFRGKSI